MTPGKFTIPFYQGAAWSFSFAFTNLVNAPIDLTGMGPFVMTLKKSNSNADIISIEGTGAYDATGIVTFSFTKAQTERFPLGPIVVGARDVNDLPYMFGQVEVYAFPS